jgi:hypothetical protein
MGWCEVRGEVGGMASVETAAHQITLMSALACVLATTRPQHRIVTVHDALQAHTAPQPQ